MEERVVRFLPAGDRIENPAGRKRQPRLLGETRHGRGKFQVRGNGARRRPGRHRAENALREWAQAVLGGEQAGARKDAPPQKVAARDLPVRQRLDDLKPVFAGIPGFM